MLSKTHKNKRKHSPTGYSSPRHPLMTPASRSFSMTLAKAALRVSQSARAGFKTSPGRPPTFDF